jgi:hypothetical protein
MTGGGSTGSAGVHQSCGTGAPAWFATVDEVRLVYTVEAAAAVLEVRSSKAYKMARQYRASGGRQGLPVFQLGRCLRVPAWALWELALYGKVVNLYELASAETDLPGRLPATEMTAVAASRVRSGAARPPSSSDIGSVRPLSASSGRRRAGSVEQFRLLPGE